MEIAIADQQVFLFKDQITPQYAEVKARGKKMVAFNTLSKFSNLLSHPKDDDFELVYSEHRYQPFWHVGASTRYVYDRDAKYRISTRGPEVKSVTCIEKHYNADNGYIEVPVTEHCAQEEDSEVFIDAITGKNQTELAGYMTFAPEKMQEEFTKMVPQNSIFVPPQMRVSAIIRDILSKMIKAIQADKINEEAINIPMVDLYYRPVYAFQYLWKPKGKEAIVEVDALTGTVKSGSRVFSEYIGKVLDQNFLFDLGADVAGLLFPGGSIAVKVVKKCIDMQKNKK
ncbi:MAG: hypothetical protein ACYCXQ_10935 [Candidatus Humimicrobiaceae bacterium]